MIPKRLKLRDLDEADSTLEYDRSSSLKDLDEQLVLAIEPEFRQVDPDQFRGNAAYFLNIDQRPHSLERKEGRG
jgi:hypothetical protein